MVDAVEFGLTTGVAHVLLDHHANQISRQQQPTEVHVHLEEDQPYTHYGEPAPENLDITWDQFIGQEKLIEQLQVHLASARKRSKPFPHTLLASGRPGVGKSQLATLVAHELGSTFTSLVPPFHRDTLFAAARGMPRFGVLYIDEIHKMADHGKRNAEHLLHILEEGRVYSEGEVYVLNPFTLIGATTDADKLPETILGRFPFKPYFEEYSFIDLLEITCRFERTTGPRTIWLSGELRAAIAMACRGTPRVIRELVTNASAWTDAYGHQPTAEVFLDFMSLTPDGFTPKHREYVTYLYRFPRQTKDGIEYVAGETTMRSVMRETADGILRLERELMEAGLVRRTPQGRCLTAKGLQRAIEWTSGEAPRRLIANHEPLPER